MRLSKHDLCQMDDEWLKELPVSNRRPTGGRSSRPVAERQTLAEQSITHITRQPEPLPHTVCWLAPGEQRGLPGS